MINDKIVTVGEKLKDFRLKIGAKQKDISNGFTHNHISKLEKDTRYKMASKTAITLIEGFRKYITENEIEVECIPLWYFLESIEAQVERVIKYKFEELRNINIEDKEFDEKIKDILKLTNKHERYDLGIEMYRYAEKKASDKGLIEKRLDYSHEGAELAYSRDIEAYTDFKLSSAGAYIIKGYYDESLRINKRILKLLDPHDVDKLKKIFFNIGLAYYHKGNYIACNTSLERLINAKYIDIDESLDKRIKSLQIGCFININDLDRAENECNELLDKLNTEDCELLWKTYKSLSAISFRKEDYMTAKNYIEQALRFKSSIKVQSLLDLYMDAGDIYTKVDMLEKAIEQYKNCLELAQALKKESIADKALNKITALYIKLKRVDELEALYSKVA